MIKRKQQHFLSLYQPIHNRFERFCRARAFYDMPYEDLINETLLVAFKKFDSLKNEEAFLSFLIGICKRILANAKRKKRTETVEDEYKLLNYPDTNDHTRKLSDTDLLYRALAKLPEQQREAIILFELTGFSIKEIMEIQDSSESAVKQRLRRGRQSLTNIVKQDYSFKMGGAV